MASKEKKLMLKMSPRIIEYLDQLVASGLFGETREEAAELLLCRGLQKLVPNACWIERKKGPS